MKFKEHRLAHEFLDGLQGLEIGAAAHNPFGLKTRNVAPRDDFAFYSGAQQKVGVAPARVDIWASAEAIPVPNDSEDFVISSHVVEHLPNVIAAFCEWNRIVRAGGYIFMIVPRRNALPEDVGRDITPLEHFLSDFRLDVTLDTHPTEGVPGGRMGHYHVFEPASILAIVEWMKDQKLCAWQLVGREDVDSKVGNGFTLVFQVLTKSGIRSKEMPNPLPEGRGDDPSVVGLTKTVAIHSRIIADQQQIIDEKNRQLDEKQAAIDDLRLIMQTEKDSTSGRAITVLRAARDYLCPANTWRGRAFRVFRRGARLILSEAVAGRFQKAISRLRKRPGRVWDARRRAKLTTELTRLRYQPLISIVTPVYNVAEPWLRKAVESVREQIYPHWQLCLVNDASPAEWIKPILDAYASADSRIRVKHLQTNEGIAGASNHALALAAGEFVGLLDHDDELTPDALFEVVKCLNENPALDLLYSDEDKIRGEGVETEPFFKPGWNPDLLLSCNYITHFSVFRRVLLQKIGGFQQGFDGSQDYDLLLRFTEETNRIAHIGKVLYHWRAIRGSAAESPTAKPTAYIAARKAVGQAVRRRGYEAKVVSLSPGTYRVCYAVRGNPRVSILIQPPSLPSPYGWGRIRTGRKETRLHRCLTSLAQLTDYANYEVIVLNRSSGSRSEFQEPNSKNQIPRIKPNDKFQSFPIEFLEFGSWFLFPEELSSAEAMNRAARGAQGDYLLFLNPDLEIIRPDWLSALLEQAQRTEVGAVGGKILGTHSRLLHSGLVVVPQGVAYRWDKNLASIHRLVYTEVVRDCSAVSAECLMVAKRKFDEVNGFDSRFRRLYHDVDLCLRLGRKGYLTVYTPHSAVQFSSAKTAKQIRSLKDEQLFQSIWGNYLRHGDPYFHDHLSKKLRLAG